MDVSQKNTVIAREVKQAKDVKRRLALRALLLTTAEEMRRERDEGGHDHSGREGKIYLADVCRRAGLKPNSLYKKNYRDLIGPINAAIADKVGPSSLGRPRNRKSADSRASEWKAHYEAVLDQLRIAEVELLEHTFRTAETQAMTPPHAGGNLVHLRPPLGGGPPSNH